MAEIWEPSALFVSFLLPFVIPEPGAGVDVLLTSGGPRPRRFYYQLSAATRTPRRRQDAGRRAPLEHPLKCSYLTH